MDNFNRGKKFGGGGGGGRKFGGRSFGGGDRGGRKSFGGDRDRDRAEMHKAICDSCKKECEVPFRPTSGKPVLCSDCFKSNRSDSPRDSRGGNRDFGRRDSKPRFDDRKSFQSEGGRDSQNYKVQLDMLNAKLDKILKALNPDVTEELFGGSEQKTETAKFKKFEKAPKKEVDTVALKKVITKTMGKKTAEDKKPVTKKVVAKKIPAKKIVKKVATKKKK